MKNNKLNQVRKYRFKKKASKQAETVADLKADSQCPQKCQPEKRMPFSARILAALRKGAAHIDDLCAIITESRPICSPSELNPSCAKWSTKTGSLQCQATGM